jgi:methylmalonyl-CoA mutase cobalamin-binding domain/chain
MSLGVDLRDLLPADLPSGVEARAEGERLGREVDRSTSLFCEHHGVKSEREFRERARKERRHLTSINIGLATWADTREALGSIYEDALSRGVAPPENFTVQFERRMGLPEAMRADAPQETGPVLWTDQDWWEVTHTVPMAPGTEDNIIGGPGSVENALQALRVGVTHVGVLSQYFWRWPYWDDDVAQTAAVVTAVGALSAWSQEGVCLNSYLDDCYPGVFHDYANLVGWAMVERHITERLMGVPYGASWGGLTRDPVTKSAVTLALQAVNPDRVPPAFTHGDTISNGPDLDANYAVSAVDVLYMKATDVRYQIGSSIKAVPVTEAVRIPSWQEVAAAHTLNRTLEEYVPALDSTLDWSRIEAIRDRLVVGGRRFFANVMEGFEAGGIDVADPLQMLLALKSLGAIRCEELFGVGAVDESFPRGRRPILQTDLLRRTLAEREEFGARIAAAGNSAALAGKRVVVTSTDVHEMAAFLLCNALGDAGAEVVDLGVSRDPEDIVKAAIETEAGAIVVTTHNGVARSFARSLLNELKTAEVAGVDVYMGGVLNEDEEESEVPRDVTADLLELGVRLPGDVGELVASLAAGGARPSEAAPNLT